MASTRPTKGGFRPLSRGSAQARHAACAPVPMGRLTLRLIVPRLFGSGPGSSPSGTCDVVLRDVRQGMLHGVCDSVL